MSRSIPFSFEMPVSFFEKADAPAGKKRRIGGILSTEKVDQQGERLLQRGLDFNPFLKSGWFNDNHSKKTTDILGYPEGVQLFAKGQRLPDGQITTSNSTWVEGYLLKSPKADEVWTLGKALEETNRRLGFSVEGRITKRIGPDRKTVAKAVVRNAAVTNCPVNDDSRLEVLAKSLQAVEDSEPDAMEKMLGMGTGGGAGATPQPAGPQSGATAGQVLAGESLERKGNPPKNLSGKPAKDDEEEAEKSMAFDFSPERAMAMLRERIPGATPHTLRRVLTQAARWKREGQL
jgi:hypothetical protein